MVVTNIGISGVALLLGTGSTKPAYISIGTGSGTALATRTSLITSVGIQAFTETNISTLNKVTWTADWNSVDMSGIELKEFGLLTGSPTGHLWDYVNLGDAVSFDGTNELRLEITWEIT